MKNLKNTFFSLFALLIISSCNGQWGDKIKGNGKVVTEKRSTDSYDEIKLAGSMDFQLVNGNEGDITITGESNIIEYIITEVNDGVLSVKFKNNINVSYGSKPIKINIPVEAISYISLAGSSDVTSNQIIKNNDFSVKISGSGNIDLEIETKNTKASVTGSGDLTLKGTTENYKPSVTGSGDIHSKNLTALNASAKVTGSGTIDLMVKTDFKAKITGSGNINYYGNPENVDKKVVGSGDINKKG